MNPVVRPSATLAACLERIDGRGYKAYRELEGPWDFGDFVLHVDRVQLDPFAPPSRVRVVMEAAPAGLPGSAFRSHARTLGTAAYLARVFRRHAEQRAVLIGTGGGAVRMAAPGQEVMAQTAVQVRDDGAVEARFGVGLPARGRRVMAAGARELLAVTLPAVVRGALAAGSHDPTEIETHAATNEDAGHLRSALRGLGLVAFVADGAVLPRMSGVDAHRLDGAVPFGSPDSLRTTIDVPNAGRVTGMGIPQGVTLIVGGAFHGKSTLLRAIEAGVYDHRPGDGRERVVTVADAVKVRAEDGRAVAGVDISGFIDGLPLGVGTSRFTTTNASGSTSQAAAIVEAMEAGTSLLLIDEDTSATNLMSRDRRMQALVPSDGEPITPFIDRARTLFEDHGVSTILVVGATGDFLDVADTVVRMEAYRPADVTERARAVAREHPSARRSEANRPLAAPTPRTPTRDCVSARRGRKAHHVRVADTDTLRFGAGEIDLSAVEQFVSEAQVRAVGQALARLAPWIDGRRTVGELLDRIEEEIAGAGLDVLDGRLVGDLAAFRRHELAATMNRLRTLGVD